LKKNLPVICCLLSIALVQGVAFGIERFSPPDFESGHQLPQPTTPEPRESVLEYLDVAVLFLALLLASYLVLKRRSRKLIFVLMIFSIAYFGFWRKGCICPIGAIQNAVFTIFDTDYAASITVILFLLIPLGVTLFFGRTFCAGICPLGAIQDLFLLKPIRVPPWLESTLRLLAYAYLGLAVLFAATGCAFVICRYDPFIGFFRMSATLNMLIVGMCFLLVGIFIGRPYCRFFCPYGILLRLTSRISRWRVTITPDECIKCRLCQDACPFGAIESPAAEWIGQDYDKGRKRLAFVLGTLPILILLGGWGVSLTARKMSRVHPTVRLADRIYLEESGQAKDTTDTSAAFRGTGRSVEELYAETVSIQSAMRRGSWILGGFLGLVIGLKLIMHCVRRPRTDYEAEKGQCLACGRCFEYCPRERLRLGKLSKQTISKG
jgi:ferredoxin